VNDYLPLVVTFVLALVFAVGSIVTVKFVAPRRPTAAKSAPYESGIVPTREPPSRFPVRFYLVAMIFVIFDIEIIFLFPWAVTYRSMGGYALGVIAEFTIPFVIAFVWLISQGGLDWGPIQRVRRFPVADVDVVDDGRATTTTIRRVGLEGREEVS
jgi:NADH-quinone oxidoreductase subunit A